MSADIQSRNEEGLRACKKILEVVDQSGEDDLFITLMSGGSSALMGCPIEGINLEDEKKTTDILLKSGAGILEINAIRRHISQMNGGNLAKRIQAVGAEMIGFSIFDVVGYPLTGDISIPYPNLTGTPIGADNTTLEDARRVIHDYKLEDRLPKSVVDYLMHCGPEGETAKEFPEFTYYGINSLPDFHDIFFVTVGHTSEKAVVFVTAHNLYILTLTQNFKFPRIRAF